ncbi:hypothetical protein [Streptosporangium sp. G12]
MIWAPPASGASRVPEQAGIITPADELFGRKRADATLLVILVKFAE